MEVTGSRSVMTRMVNRGGTEMGVWRREEVEEGAESDGDVNDTGVGVVEGRGADRTLSWKDVDSTLHSAAVRLE